MGWCVQCRDEPAPVTHAKKYPRRIVHVETAASATMVEFPVGRIRKGMEQHVTIEASNGKKE